MYIRFILPVLSLLLLITPGLHAETPVYGVLASNSDSPYWRTLELGMREGANDEEVEYYGHSVDATDADAAAQRCNSILDRKPNVLLVALPDISMLPTCFDKAQSLNIPVISIGNSNNQLSDRKMLTITTDHNETASITAEYLASLSNTTDGVVVIPITERNQQAVKSIEEKLQASAPAMNVIAAAPQELINVAPDIRAIISTDNDSILETVDKQNDGNVLILSLDDQSDNTTLLETGMIQAAITPLPYLLGKTAMQQASTAITAKNSEGSDAIFIKPVLLTPKVLNDRSNPIFQYIK